MGRWDERYLGQNRFPEAVTSLEIERFFAPTDEERAIILQRRTALNKIAYTLQLGFLMMTGRSLNSVEIVPPLILEFVGEKV